jgi:hypothetical protein
LETKFCPNRRIFVFWRPFWIQNGRHSKPKWSPYGAACLTPCKHPFPLKYFNFWIFNNLFWFYIGSHFEMAAVLKILKTKSTTLSDDLLLCQVSKWSTVRSEFNIFCTLVIMATAAILNFFNPSKAATHYGGYSYKVSWSLMIGIQNLFKFCFHGNCGKAWRVICYDNFCVFHFFSTLAVSIATAAILKKSTLDSTTSHGIWYSYKVS